MRTARRRIGSALPLLALLLIASATAPRIAQAQGSGLVCPPATASQETVCNLEIVSDRASSFVGVNTANGDNAQQAAAFTTGATDVGYILRSATIGINGDRGSPTAFEVALHAEAAGGGPGAELAELTGDYTPAPGIADEYEYTASGIIRLEPRTTYYLVMSAEITDNTRDRFYDLSVVQSPDETDSSSDGWSIGDRGWFRSGNGAAVATSGAFTEYTLAATPRIAIVADPVALRLKLRVFLESALP